MNSQPSIVIRLHSSTHPSHSYLPQYISLSKIKYRYKSLQGKPLETSFKECEELQKKDPKSKSKLILVKLGKKPLIESLPFMDAEKLKVFLDLPTSSSIVVGYGKDTDVVSIY